jgi:hypothetical protein
VHSLQQLRRDPHILTWFTSLRSHQPPLATVTYAIHLFHLRRMLEELAWTEDLPALAHLVLRQDTPRQEHYLPGPLPADQDKIIQQELLRRDHFLRVQYGELQRTADRSVCLPRWYSAALLFVFQHRAGRRSAKAARRRETAPCAEEYNTY